MQKIAPFQARAMLLSVLLVLLLAACGGETSQPTPAGPNPTTDAIPLPTGTTPAGPNPTTDAIPAPTSTMRVESTTGTGSSGALDLSSLDVCAFVPREILAGIFGPLKDEGTPDTVLGKEKGCTFYNEEGNFADMRIYPPDEWELRKNLESDKIEVGGLGDEAFAVDKSDAYDLWVLAQDLAVMEVRVSTHDEEQARLIAEALLAQLP
ncbi:MAG TPA: hypothetical protein VND68_13735 [Chloroflexia bacterium]|nr:hypothetical protein [Chloroflexia bacterium]